MKRIVAMLLLLAVTAGMFPAVVYADNTDSPDVSNADAGIATVAYEDELFYPINVVGKGSDPAVTGGDAQPQYGYTYLSASQNLVDMIKSCEGFVEHEYGDNTQVSIGYGTVIRYHVNDIISNYVYNDARKAADVAKLVAGGMSEFSAWAKVNSYGYKYKITPADGELFLRRAMSSFESELNKFCIRHKIQLNQHQFDALLDLTYARGISWLYDSERELIHWLKNPTDEMGFLNAIGGQYFSRVYSSSSGIYHLQSSHAYRRIRDAVMFLHGEYSIFNRSVPGLESCSLPVVYDWNLPYYKFVFYYNDKVYLSNGTDGEMFYDEILFYRKGETYGDLLSTDGYGKTLTYTDGSGRKYVLKGWQISGDSKYLTSEDTVSGILSVNAVWEEGTPTPPPTEPPTTQPETQPPATKPSFPFTDVGENNYYRDAVEYVYERGIMEGVSESMFDIYGTMTRGMLVTVLYRMAGSPAVTANSSFTDVASDAYYADAVSWAKSKDLVDGVSVDKFDPNDEMTQEEFVTLLYRYCIYYCGLSDIKPGSLDNYGDAEDIAFYAQTPFAWCVSAGIITAEDGEKLRPGEDAIRGYVALMLQRLDMLVND